MNGVPIVEVTADRRKENLMGPALGSTTPQFMTNWLGSYISTLADVPIEIDPQEFLEEHTLAPNTAE